LTERIKVTLRLGRWARPRGLANIPHQRILQAVSSFPLRTNPAQLRNLRFLFALAAMLVPTALSFNVSTARRQQTPGREIAFPKTIQWNKQRGVTRYRLQIAGDEQFQNVFFDGPVTGEQYIVSGLSAGYYYWRVAPVDSRSRFSQPVRLFISGGVVTTVRLPSRATSARSSAIVSSKVR